MTAFPAWPVSLTETFAALYESLPATLTECPTTSAPNDGAAIQRERTTRAKNFFIFPPFFLFCVACVFSRREVGKPRFATLGIIPCSSSSGTLHKGTAGAKRRGEEGSRQAAYYVNVKREWRMLRNQGVGLSEVSVLVPSCSDTVLASMPSFFMRVMNVVRLRPRRLAAPFGPPMRPSVSLSARMI